MSSFFVKTDGSRWFCQKTTVGAVFAFLSVCRQIFSLQLFHLPSSYQFLLNKINFNILQCTVLDAAKMFQDLSISSILSLMIIFCSTTIINWSNSIIITPNQLMWLLQMAWAHWQLKECAIPIEIWHFSKSKKKEKFMCWVFTKIQAQEPRFTERLTVGYQPVRITWVPITFRPITVCSLTIRPIYN